MTELYSAFKTDSRPPETCREGVRALPAAEACEACSPHRTKKATTAPACDCMQSVQTALRCHLWLCLRLCRPLPAAIRRAAVPCGTAAGWCSGSGCCALTRITGTAALHAQRSTWAWAPGAWQAAAWMPACGVPLRSCCRIS